MREIEFKALAAVNDKRAGIKKGDMVHGQFIQSGIDAPCIVFGDGEQIEIDRKTLGQYTGLKDKNGVKIFEGDVLDFEEKEWGGRFRPEAISMDKIRGKWDLCGSVSDVSEWRKVIGNIHQNPELLEKKS